MVGLQKVDVIEFASIFTQPPKTPLSKYFKSNPKCIFRT